MTYFVCRYCDLCEVTHCNRPCPLVAAADAAPEAEQQEEEAQHE